MDSHRNAAPRRALLADADTARRRELQQALEQAGFQVIAAECDGEIALEKARKMRPDVVVMSTKVCDIDALSLTAALSHERIAPVVLIAEETDKHLVRRAVVAGVYSFLTRPLRAETLLPTIEIACERWRSEMRQHHIVARLREKEETLDLVERAKRMLMTACGFSEFQAHRYLQEHSMNKRRPMREVAQAFITTHETLSHSLPDSLFEPLEANA